MGGVAAALEVARRAYAQGDYRWSVEVCKHAVFADGANQAARVLLADGLEQLGFGAENGTWRNEFLAGALELREGNFGTPTTVASADLMGAVTVAQLFDSLAVRIDGPKAWNEHLTITWVITDTGETHVTELRNGSLNHRAVTFPQSSQATFTLTRPTLIGLVSGAVDLHTAIADGSVGVVGDPAVLGQLVGLVAAVDPAFAIVTP